MDISKQAFQLKKALNESRYTVAITGAGILFSAAPPTRSVLIAGRPAAGAACQWQAFSTDRSGSGDGGRGAFPSAA